MTERDRRRKIIDHLRAGETQSAADELAGSHESYPGDGLLHHVIGLAFASNGTLGAALEQLETAARLSPRSAAILADLAQVLLAHGSAEEAIGSAEAALDADPSLAIAHFTLGRACLVVETAKQSRRAPAPPTGFDFPVIDGRAPLYLRALSEMETALDEAPPFIAAIRGTLAFAYLRAGHFHAALEQLRVQLVELLSGDEADRVADRLRSVEYEIARESYWTAVAEDGRDRHPPQAGACPHPEELLRTAHACAVSEYGTGDTTPAIRDALACARAAGYAPRPTAVTRFEAEDAILQQLSDIHSLIAGGLECVHEGELRFLPFDVLHSVALGPPNYWRDADVEMTSGQMLQVAVPSLYRLSLCSPNDLIQSGRFTQFKYEPGETRYARAIGSRNLATENGIIPFADVRALRFV